MRLEWTTYEWYKVFPGRGIKDYKAKGTGTFPYYLVRTIQHPEHNKPWVCFAYRNDDYEYWPLTIGYFDELEDALAAAQEHEDRNAKASRDRDQ